MRHRESISQPFDWREEISTEYLHLDLLGAFRLRQDDQPVAGFGHARLQHLLAYLALNRAAPISRQQLAFLFWPDSSDQQALKNLRTLLTRLRHALPGTDHLIDITAQIIQWRPDAPFTLDVTEFETAAAQGITAQAAGDNNGAANALAVAASRYTGELLPNCYDDWILPQRERLHQTCGNVLERLVLLLEERREYGRALLFARRLLSHDPMHEAAYHHLIRLHLALGDRTEALRLCNACDAMLEQELGLAPALATRVRYERLLEIEGEPARVAWEQPPGLPSSGLPLVGRAAEWSRLMAVWRAAATGHAQMVLLSGEAGIGKTRLAEEFCTWIARQGVAVVTAHCYPAGDGVSVAYAPVVEWLHDRALQSRLDALEEVWATEVARIFPSLLVGRPQLKSPGPLTEAWQRTRLFEALSRAVLGTEQRAPLLLFLDDLQWCDQETLDWLGYLLRFAARAPLLILAAVRKYEIDRLHPLMAFWLTLTRSGLLSEIPLAPLDAAETGLLAAHVTGRVVEASEASRIYSDTEGNPLFVVEMLRAGEDRSPSIPATPLAIPSTPAALPPKVRAVIQWRLAQLSPAAQALAQTAAVIGRKFSFDVLARASGQSEAAVMEGLDELWRRQLVRTQGKTAYDFTHDGIRAVAYDDTGPIRRGALHLRVAQALEVLHQDDLDSFSSQIAGHYEQAGHIQPAISFYRRAASLAESIYANATAAALYQHLLESDLSAGLPTSEKCALRLALAEIWRATGQWAQSEHTNREALAEAEYLGDIHLAARARCALADVLHLLGYYDAAMQWLAEAEQGFQAAGKWRGMAGALHIMGKIHWLRGDHPKALATLERQLEIATRIDDPRGICEALQATGMVLWSQGDWEQAAANCLKSILIAGPLEYKPILTRAAITLGDIRSGEHWFGEAVYWYQSAAALAREIDDRQALSWATANIAQILAKRGDHAQAIAGYERSLRIAWEIGDRWAACLIVAGLAAIYEHLGKADEAESLYRQAIDLGLRLYIPSYLAGMLVDLARLLLAQGRAEEARRVYEDALAQISGITGERLAGEDTRFAARVLSISLRHALGETTVRQAAEDLRALLVREELPARQAALYFELWRIVPEDEAACTTAAALYQAEYAETSAEECRRRYEQLTGERLPDPPPLPDVSELIPDSRESPDPAQVLAGLKASFE